MSDEPEEETVDLLAKYLNTEQDQFSVMPCLMLSVEDRLKQRWAFSYALLTRIEFDVGGSNELVLFLSTHRVRVLGWCLETLYHHLREHRVAVLMEAKNVEFETEGDGELVVKEISVEEV